jgi:NAD(P)-dependent dehydrogenase (short-subunit alcohol dehydrogenase family)
MYASGSSGALAPTSESVSFGKSLAGKLAIVTGASTGVGTEIARVLALRGAHVWVCGRSEEKSKAAIESSRHSMRTRRCHQSGACCSCRKEAPCPSCCCSRCQLAPRLIEDMRKSIGDKADAQMPNFT